MIGGGDCSAADCVKKVQPPPSEPIGSYVACSHSNVVPPAHHRCGPMKYERFRTTISKKIRCEE